MRAAVDARRAVDRAKVRPRDELQMYLAAPLEQTENVVAWWGVSFEMLCFVYKHLMSYPATLASIPNFVTHGQGLPCHPRLGNPV